MPFRYSYWERLLSLVRLSRRERDEPEVHMEALIQTAIKLRVQELIMEGSVEKEGHR